MSILRDDDFHELFKIPDIDWCFLMAGGKKSHSMVRSVFKSFRENMPQLFKKCPLAGRFSFPHLTPNKRWITMFPTGTYRYTFKVSNLDCVELNFAVSFDFIE